MSKIALKCTRYGWQSKITFSPSQFKHLTHEQLRNPLIFDLAATFQSVTVQQVISLLYTIPEWSRIKTGVVCAKMSKECKNFTRLKYPGSEPPESKKMKSR